MLARPASDHRTIGPLPRAARQGGGSALLSEFTFENRSRLCSRMVARRRHTPAHFRATSIPVTLPLIAERCHAHSRGLQAPDGSTAAVVAERRLPNLHFTVYLTPRKFVLHREKPPGVSACARPIFLREIRHAFRARGFRPWSFHARATAVASCRQTPQKRSPKFYGFENEAYYLLGVPHVS